MIGELGVALRIEEIPEEKNLSLCKEKQSVSATSLD